MVRCKQINSLGYEGTSQGSGASQTVSSTNPVFGIAGSRMVTWMATAPNLRSVFLLLYLIVS